MSWNCNSSGFFGSIEFNLPAACLVALAALSLAGCGALPNAASDESRPPAVDRSGAASGGVPPAAIAVTPELYMLPMGTDGAGCAVFQPWSPTMAVVQALHWRKADGSFTLDRAEADCP